MNMILSLRKDVRAGRTPLFLTAVILLGIAVASLLLGIKNAAGMTPAILFVGGHYLGAFALGHEFDHRTWALQLTQPSKRWQLWLTKLALSFGILLLTYLLTLAIMELTQPGHPGMRRFIGMIAIAAFSGPPLFVQYTRSTLGAAAVSFLMLEQEILDRIQLWIATWRVERIRIYPRVVQVVGECAGAGQGVVDVACQPNEAVEATIVLLR